MIKNMVERYLLFLITGLLFLPIGYSIDYYADIEIEVDKTGFVSIKGNTNHPDLLTVATGEYTSKKQLFWLFNLSTEETFSNYVVSVILPEDSSINYVKSLGVFRIEERGGRLAVNSFGENEKISIIAQYQVAKDRDNYIGVMIIVLIPLIGIFLYFIFRKKKNIIYKEAPGSREYNLEGLTTRQKKIMNLLIKEKRPLTQAEIEKELKIPKASVSRNIKTLELKGRVEKEKTGMSNIIRLKKE